MDTNILLIINPQAKKGHIQKKAKKIEENLKQDGFVVDTKYTKKEYNATNIIEDYDKKVDIIMACGGDGTLNEVVNAVMKKELEVSISFLPFGTTNDFSHTVGIPIKNLKLTKNLKQGKIQKCDIGNLFENHFYYIAAFGIFTKVAYSTTVEAKKKWGKLAYYFKAFEEIKERKSHHVKVNIDGQVIEDDFIYGSITNSVSVGGFRWFKKGEIEIDDGKFEVLLLRYPKNFIKLIKLLWKLLWRNHKDENICYYTGSKITVEAKEELAWTIDGEYGGKSSYSEIKNIPQKLELITLK